MKRLTHHRIMELLSTILHCPVCNNKYNAEQTNIIEENADKYEGSPMLVHSDCESCKSSVVFSISLDGPEVLSVGMVTDLTSQDARKFRDNRGISADEVLDFHEFVKTFDGDFERALR